MKKLLIHPISSGKWIVLTYLLIFSISCNNSNSDQNRCKVYPFELNDVKLLDGPFKHATELNEKSLLSYDSDRLLSKFRSEAGLKPKASPLLRTSWRVFSLRSPLQAPGGV